MQCGPHTNPVFLSNPPSPFSKGVVLNFGRLFSIKGSTSTSARRFSFNLLIGGRDEDNALHVDVRFDDACVVRNSRRGGTWLREERAGVLPLQAGQDFELMVLVEEPRFMIAFNGTHFTEFVHRLPVCAIDTVFIAGDVNIGTYQESMGFSGAKPGRLLTLKEGSRTDYNVGSCLGPGGKINIAGVPTGETFVIDLRPDVDAEDIGLHISCRVHKGVVVLNSRVGQTWQQEIRPSNVCFKRGDFFHLKISCEGESELTLTQNGHAVTAFPIRHIPALYLRGLVIHGDVDIGYVSL